MRAKLAKGMGHNYYGEPAWPNDLLYIFPVVILGTIACIVVALTIDDGVCTLLIVITCCVACAIVACVRREPGERVMRRGEVERSDCASHALSAQQLRVALPDAGALRVLDRS